MSIQKQLLSILEGLPKHGGRGGKFKLPTLTELYTHLFGTPQPKVLVVSTAAMFSYI